MRISKMSDAFKNYITPGGYGKLQEELTRLWKVERPAMVTTVAWATVTIVAMNGVGGQQNALIRPSRGRTPGIRTPGIRPPNGTAAASWSRRRA